MLFFIPQDQGVAGNVIQHLKKKKPYHDVDHV